MSIISGSRWSRLVNGIIINTTVIISVTLISCSEKNAFPIMKAESKQATVIVEGSNNLFNWTIVPEARPDVFPLEVEPGIRRKVTFMTDIDTLTLRLSAGEQKDFVILVNGTDSAFTRIQSVQPAVHFSEEYKKTNKGSWSVEVPEVKELLLIAAVITPTGLADTRSMIINHDSTEYYRDVMEYFLPFKEEPVVAKVDSLLQNGWYINLKADAVAYEFNDSGTIVNTPTYDRMRGAANLLEPFLPLLNDFAEKTDFRSFYRNHRELYDSLISWHDQAISTKRQWDWLEAQFPDHSYDHYRITFSPLVKGNHSTVRFNQNGFKQAVMFIRPPYKVRNVSERISNGLITRFVFTEIDHNYVNPETDNYVEEVNRAFTDREFWTNGRESSNYRSPYTIFNEYMTWAVYLLYIHDTYPPQDFEYINNWTVKYKIERRGFHKFDAFNDELQRLYFERSANTTVADLYPSLLQWAEEYSQQ